MLVHMGREAHRVLPHEPLGEVGIAALQRSIMPVCSRMEVSERFSCRMETARIARMCRNRFSVMSTMSLQPPMR